MNTDTEICSMAMLHIGNATTIASMNQDTPEAEACNRVYDSCLRAQLMDHAWGFSKKQVALVEVDEETLDGFQYVYVYPADALLVHRIVNRKPQYSAYPVDYHYSYSPQIGNAGFVEWTQLGDRIHANVQPAHMSYTSNDDNMGHRIEQFKWALSYLVAVKVERVLTGKSTNMMTNQRFYDDAITKAKSQDQKNDHRRPDRADSIVNAGY